MNKKVEYFKSYITLKYIDPMGIFEALVNKKLDRRGRYKKQAIEELIATCPKTSFWYAKKILKGRFKLAEKDILLSRECMSMDTHTGFAVMKISNYYIDHILSKHWSDEDIPDLILLNSHACYLYARHIKGRWGPGEKEIATSARYSCLYARDVIKGRWEEVEKIILSSSYYSYLYARGVIKGRWEEGESIIASNNASAREYARDIIKGRWEPGEKAIATNEFSSIDYLRDLNLINPNKAVKDGKKIQEIVANLSEFLKTNTTIEL